MHKNIVLSINKDELKIPECCVVCGGENNLLPFRIHKKVITSQERLRRKFGQTEKISFYFHKKCFMNYLIIKIIKTISIFLFIPILLFTFSFLIKFNYLIFFSIFIISIVLISILTTIYIKIPIEWFEIDGLLFFNIKNSLAYENFVNTNKNANNDL
jgi:hypothetical protein